MSDNVPSDMCARRRFRSAWAFATLIRMFTVRVLDSQWCKVSSCKQEGSVQTADAQVDLRTCETVRFLTLRLIST